MNTRATPAAVTAPTPAQALEKLSTPATPYFDKLEAFAKQWKAEEAEDERRRLAEQDAYWEGKGEAE